MATPVPISDDVEMEKIAEDELEKLQKQFRIMEQDKTSVINSAQPMLRVQRQIILLLEAEHNKVMTELKLAKSTQNIVDSIKIKETLSALIKDNEKYNQDIKLERIQMREIDFLLKQVNNEIKKLRSASAVSAEEYNHTLTQSTMVNQLENRLDNTLKKLNTCNTENRRLRSYIDRLLFDRQSFNVLWSHKIKELMEGKVRILVLVEEAINTYDQREEWCSKLEALKEKAANDYRKHCQQIRDLQRQLEHSLKLEDFLRTKSAGRQTITDVKAEAKKQRDLQLEQCKHDNNLKVLESIKEFTDNSDLEKIIQEFVKREEENYAVFNYVNEVNCEFKNLEDNVKNLKLSLDEERAKHRARRELQVETVDTLKQKLENIHSMNEASSVECDKSERVLRQLMLDVQYLVKMTDCESLPIMKLFGNKAHVNINNIKIYMKAIEVRITEVVDVIQEYENAKRLSQEMNQKTPPSSRRKSVRTARKSPRERLLTPSPRPVSRITLNA